MLGAGLLVASCILVGLEPAPLGAIRDTLFDNYQRLMPRERRTAPAVIVEIDERTLDARGQWPWPRSVVAELIEAIGANRPAAIGVDILFVEPDRSSATSDGILAKAIQGKDVVLGIAGLEYRDRRYPFPPQAVPTRVASGRDVPLRRYDGHLQSRPEINRAAAGRGLLSSDAKGVVRRVPLLAHIGQVIVPALSVDMLRVATNAPFLRVTDRGGERVELAIGDLVVPLQSDGSAYVYFGLSDAERFVSAQDVLARAVPADVLKDKLVLVGVTGLGLLDFQLTPLGERIPGVEIHAQLLEQMFDGSFLRRPSRASWLEAALLAIAGLVLVLAVPVLRPLGSCALVVAATVVLAVVGLLAFRMGYLVNVAAPVLGVAATFAALLAGTYAEADRQRRLLREAQARVAGELEAAQRIQMGLLPAPREIFAREKRFELEALLEPARTVGGDFYDCFMLDEHRLFFLVGDVSGKGLGASLFMALSKSLVKSIALRDAGDPAAILARANAEISRDNRESLFVTALAGVLDARSGELVYCNAGHEPPVASVIGETPQRVMQSGGPPLCVIEGYAYTSAILKLSRGGWFCVVTDGVTEAMNERGELYGSVRLLEKVKGIDTPRAIVQTVRDDVRRFAASAEQSDDLTLLCVRWGTS
ncbi:MAG TPA: CHASE2 domain-containing protein [Burkholderiales bacterium]|nr:CHASE2 domain-containing protein [Burkholderiales bacterium]